MLRRTLAPALTALALTGCVSTAPAAPSALDQELADLLQVLPGKYAGQAPDMSSATAGLTDIYHKLTRIEAPQFGEEVLYYQLSNEGPDGAAMQMKIFVFDLSAERTSNRMSAYVFAPGQAEGNLEQDPERLAAITPDQLMDFPAECAFKWAATEEGFLGEVKAEDCAFQGQTFKTTIRPNMTYGIYGDRFEWDETLLRDSGEVIVSTNGALPAFRVDAGE